MRQQRHQKSTPSTRTSTEEPKPAAKTAAVPESSSPEADGDSEGKTTVMLRNVPNWYTRSMLLELLEDEGLGGAFDFVYLPMDFTSQSSLGHAFVNFCSESDALRCWQIFDGLTEWGRPCSN